jgi:hypothetical protein
MLKSEYEEEIKELLEEKDKISELIAILSE